MLQAPPAPLLEEELLDEELDELLELEAGPPLQLPPATPLPLMRKLSMLAKPALFVASRRSKLLPACKLIVTLAELTQVVQAPVPLKAKLAWLAPFTCRLAERALEPLAYTKCSA